MDKIRQKEMREKAERFARSNLMQEYQHHSYEEEKKLMFALLKGRIDLLETVIPVTTYEDVLAPERMRSVKNTAICVITLVCRAAIELGVAEELSFSLSDFYVNEIEKETMLPELILLVNEIVRHYSDLVQEQKSLSYSLPVIHCIRYIRQNIFSTCKVKEVAQAIGLNADYLSSLFKREVGIGMAAFIKERKMQEARHLLLFTRCSITDVAEMLGYTNSAHFSADFKQHFGQSPRRIHNL